MAGLGRSIAVPEPGQGTRLCGSGRKGLAPGGLNAAVGLLSCILTVDSSLLLSFHLLKEVRLKEVSKDEGQALVSSCNIGCNPAHKCDTRPQPPPAEWFVDAVG